MSIERFNTWLFVSIVGTVGFTGFAFTFAAVLHPMAAVLSLAFLVLSAVSLTKMQLAYAARAGDETPVNKR